MPILRAELPSTTANSLDFICSLGCFALARAFVRQLLNYTFICCILLFTMSALRCSTSAAELFYLRHLRSCAATAYGSNGTGHPGYSSAVGKSWLAFLGLEAALNAVLQSMLVLRLRVQIVTRRVLWLLHCMFKCGTSAVVYFLQSVLALLQGMLELEYSPLELAACFHIINASERATCFFMVGGATSELATLLLSTA